MYTGDLAVFDEAGFCTIVGRVKDMIIRGGENIYPREIEEYLIRHAKVSDVQVFGIPDEKFGEEVCAWAIAKPGAELTEDELRLSLQGPDCAFQDSETYPDCRRDPDDRSPASRRNLSCGTICWRFSSLMRHQTSLMGVRDGLSVVKVKP
jgi:acyl-CoA synthetase (AMP-forming)/AMP-acid ligase II